MTGYYAIELISYEYSDVYKLMDEESLPDTFWYQAGGFILLY